MHVYGFGQLADVKIDNLADFQVFYGENEAGKSTIMAFIHGILFGFPTKQQTELRYEPRHNSKYGGKIKILTEDRGFTVIERVKGKAAVGDVSVIAENGVIGGEDLLKELLSNIDRGLFQAIFSFNLHGLQNIHQMKGEEIGKFLFSAGTLGTDRLALAESELQKGLDARFKPGGKKPHINEKLQELHHLNNELKVAAAKNQEYEMFVQKKSLIQQEMAEIQDTIKDFQKKVENLNEWKKIEGFVKEEKWTVTELDKIGEVAFPVRGIERFESLKPLLSSYEAQIVSLSDRMEQIKKETELLHPNMSVLESESEILAVLEQYPLYQQLKLQEKQTEIKLNQFEERLAGIKEKLHLPLVAEEIDLINTNIYMKDKVEKLSRKGQSLNGMKQQLESRFNEEKSALEAIEENIESVKAKVIPDSERSQFEKQVNERLDRDRLEMKLQAVRDKIEFYKMASEQEKVTAAGLRKQKQIQYLLLAVLLLGIGVYSWVISQTLLFLLCIVGFIVSAIFFVGNLRQPIKKRDEHTLPKLLQEEQQLLQTFQTSDFRKMAALQERLAIDNSHREQLQVLRVKLEQQQHQYEKVIKRFEEWELEDSEYKQGIKEISKELKIPEYMADAYLVEAFQLIEQFKTEIREKQQLLLSKESMKSNQMEIIGRLNDLASKFFKDKNVEIQELAYLLRNKLKKEQERSVQWKEKQAKLADLEADLHQLKQERLHLESDLCQLLHEANVENENAFYELGTKAERKAKFLERLEDLEKQLHHSFLSKLERESYLQIHDADEIISEHNHEIEGLQFRLTELQEHQASIKYEIQKIEEGGLYSELLHQFKQKKYELEEDAKEWAVLNLARNILEQTIEKYKNVHLPRMLSKAEEFLSFLTDENYQKILLQQSGPGFLIVRKDQMIFEANELSQATTEQVYVAIRLALATTLYEKYHFPIIIDDSFVNFDAKRTQKVIDLLRQLKQNQILFFTCHQHLLKFFKKDELLYLNNGAIEHSIT